MRLGWLPLWPGFGVIGWSVAGRVVGVGEEGVESGLSDAEVGPTLSEGRWPAWMSR